MDYSPSVWRPSRGLPGADFCFDRTLGVTPGVKSLLRSGRSRPSTEPLGAWKSGCPPVGCPQRLSCWALCWVRRLEGESPAVTGLVAFSCSSSRAFCSVFVPLVCSASLRPRWGTWGFPGGLSCVWSVRPSARGIRYLSAQLLLSSDLCLSVSSVLLTRLH